MVWVFFKIYQGKPQVMYFSSSAFFDFFRQQKGKMYDCFPLLLQVIAF